jgi:Tfp pilus assembly protein PilF
MNGLGMGAWALIVLGAAACSSPPPQRQATPLRDLVAALGAADAHYRKRDLPAAERAYRDVLAIDPQSVEANIRLGVIAHRQGEYARAEQHFNRVLMGDPRNETAAYNLAVLHIEQAHDLFDRYLKVSSTKAAERPAVHELQRAMKQFRER